MMLGVEEKRKTDVQTNYVQIKAMYLMVQGKKFFKNLGGYFSSLLA